jgi:hypothetical protein
MILGRWLSNAFLVYIRPQVLEWTNNMSKEMIHLDNLLDVGPRNNHTTTNNPRLRKHLCSFNGSSSILVPRFHLNH